MEMPFMTKMVMNMSDFMKARWYLIIGFMVALIVGINFYKQSPSGKVILGQLGLKMPLFGRLTTKSSSARFARTLSTMLAAGIPMIEAIDITAKTMDNVIVRQALLDAKEDVAKGLPL